MKNKILTSLLALLCIACLVQCKSEKGTTKSTGIAKKGSNTIDSVDQKKKFLDSYSLDVKIGQMILMGINDRKVIEDNDSILLEIKKGLTGGIILFEKNINPTNSFENLKKLIARMQQEAPVPLFMSIDEEGGKVHRLKEKYGFVKMPSASYLGAFTTTDSNFYYASQLGKELNELGFNVNFAPDVDVALNPNNPVIVKAGRSYSSNPDAVAMQAAANIRGQHVSNVKTVLKHFPGHGSSMTDSHYGITDVTNLWKEEELVPYQKLIANGDCDAIMTAHIVNCKLDTTCFPATLSKPIVTDLLRGKLKFNGVVFSDDMQMYAISKNYGTENALKLSINAGVDIVVFGNNVNATDRTTAAQVHAMIKKLIADGEISEARINESFLRIMKLKGLYK